MRNGPTIKPIELRAGIIKHMTPDMARIVGEFTAHTGSRDVSIRMERVLVGAYQRQVSIEVFPDKPKDSHVPTFARALVNESAQTRWR